jgi:hypothetical protein
MLTALEVLVVLVVHGGWLSSTRTWPARWPVGIDSDRQPLRAAL